MAERPGLRVLLRLHGGDASQWQPNLFRNTTAIFPFQDNPGWNLTTARRAVRARPAQLVAKLGTKAETARELAYRLFTLCERKKRAAEALSYNALVQSIPEIVPLAREGSSQETQGALFE